MSASTDALHQRELQSFPPWLDLPPRYTAGDWISWQKGKLIAARLREDPALVRLALQRMIERPRHHFPAILEWIELIEKHNVEEIAAIMESADDEGQRLRSSSPFVREPFVTSEEVEAIRERAHFG